MTKIRTQQLERVAFELSMDFHPTDKWGIRTFLQDFRLFRRGLRRRITNILYRRDGLTNSEWYIFDYQYTISGGNSSKVLRQTVFFIHSQQLGLPQFLMKPENFFHKIGVWLGKPDIDFEAYPKFSDQYLLKGEDEGFIRAALNDQFLQFFTLEKNWRLEGLNYYLIIYKNNVLLDSKKIKDFYRKGMRIYHLLAEES